MRDFRLNYTGKHFFKEHIKRKQEINTYKSSSGSSLLIYKNGNLLSKDKNTLPASIKACVKNKKQTI